MATSMQRIDRFVAGDGRVGSRCGMYAHTAREIRDLTSRPTGQIL